MERWLLVDEAHADVEETDAEHRPDDDAPEPWRPFVAVRTSNGDQARETTE